MKKALMLLGLFLGLFLVGCGASSGDETIGEVQSAVVTPVTVSMWNTHFAIPPNMTQTLYHMTEDAGHPSTNLTTVSVLKNAGTGAPAGSAYSTSSHQAIDNISLADWSTMSTYVNNAYVTGSWVKVILTYDSASMATNKPLLPNPGGVPQFSLCAGIGLVYGPNCG